MVYIEQGWAISVGEDLRGVDEDLAQPRAVSLLELLELG